MVDELPVLTPTPMRQRRRRRVLALALVVLALVIAFLLFRGRPVGRESRVAAPAAEETREEWFCPMHPHVVADEPGECPICRMDLVKRARAAAASTTAPTTPAAVPVGEIGGRKVLYWYDPMVPDSRFDKPGKSPFMNMELVPRYADEEPSAGTAEQGGAPSVSLSSQAIQAAGIATVPVLRQNSVHEIRAVGTIEADETKLEHVASRVAGRIERLHANFTGQPVRRGAPLYELYSPDLVATQREYLLALEQQQRLSAKGSTEAAESAEALVAAARDRLALWGITDAQIQTLERTRRPELSLTFVSPISGTVLRKDVIEGQYVDEGTDLYLLADLSSVWLVVQVYEFELGRLRVGYPVVASISAYPGREFGGRVTFIEPVLDPQTRTARVRVVLSNRTAELKPGMSADATLRIPLDGGLFVPRSAVIDTGIRQVVYVETAPATFQAREVTLGPTASDRVAVFEGLAEGEKVVATANFFIDSHAQLAGSASLQWSGALEVQEQPKPEVDR